MADFPSRDPGVFTRPGSASIRPSAITDAVYELAVRVESLEGTGGVPGPPGPPGEGIAITESETAPADPSVGDIWNRVIPVAVVPPDVAHLKLGFDAVLATDLATWTNPYGAGWSIRGHPGMTMPVLQEDGLSFGGSHAARLYGPLTAALPTQGTVYVTYRVVASATYCLVASGTAEWTTHAGGVSYPGLLQAVRHETYRSDMPVYPNAAIHTVAYQANASTFQFHLDAVPGTVKTSTGYTATALNDPVAGDYWVLGYNPQGHGQFDGVIRAIFAYDVLHDALTQAAVRNHLSTYLGVPGANEYVPMVWDGTEWVPMEGSTGAEGATGATGATGPQGATGAMGPPGPQGEVGATGAQGTTGPAGATGATGPQGPAGLGMNIKGTVPTYSALPAQPQPANDAYTTVDTGHMWVSNGTAWIDAGLIQGPQGPAGPQGIQGATGATGATGAQGIQGVKGDTGATGSQGPQGVKGDTGAQGVQGPIGTTGAQGPAGPGVPVGGTTSQVLTKTSATDFATSWQTPAPLVIPPEYVTDSELATALAPYATDTDLANHVAALDPHAVYATDAEVTAAIAAHAGAADPHAVYLTAAEGNAAYATPANITSAITAHEALANPHAIYLTQTEGDGLYTPIAHASAPDPHSQYLTQTEGDGRYTQGGITQSGADARYLQLTGGTLSGDLILSEATPLISLKQVADTQPRSRLTDIGLYFGPGGATNLDTSLLRTGANALSLGGSPVITQTLGDARYATPANITSAITAHEALSDPHPTYTTAAELSTAISNHAGLADPHPVYMTSAETAAAYQPIGTYLTQAAADIRYEPFDSAYTKAEADAKYQLIGSYLTQAAGDARYLLLTGGSLAGSLGVGTTNTYDLGTSALRWRKLYGWEIDIGTALTVGTPNPAQAGALRLRNAAVIGWRNAAATADLTLTVSASNILTSSAGMDAPSLTLAAKAVALSPNANQTLQWLANGFYSDSPTKAQYDALVARVAALEAQMGAGANGHYHLLSTWRQTAKATLPATVLEEAPAA